MEEQSGCLRHGAPCDRIERAVDPFQRELILAEHDHDDPGTGARDAPNDHITATGKPDLQLHANGHRDVARSATLPREMF
jgi:hypothetical protein